MSFFYNNLNMQDGASTLLFPPLTASGCVDSSVQRVIGVGGGCLLGNALCIPDRVWMAAFAQQGGEEGLAFRAIM